MTSNHVPGSPLVFRTADISRIMPKPENPWGPSLAPWWAAYCRLGDNKGSHDLPPNPQRQEIWLAAKRLASTLGVISKPGGTEPNLTPISTCPAPNSQE